MLIQARVRYTNEFIPPRCRKARTEIITEEIALNIPEVSVTDAPVAIETRDTESTERPPEQYRWWNGKLWTKERDHGGAPYLQVDTEGLQRHFSCTDRQWDKKESVLEALQEHEKSCVFIDGLLWGVAEEPAYKVESYSSFSRSEDSVWLESGTWEPKPNHFRADAFEEAVTYAFSLARKYRATKSEGEIVAAKPFITVHIPEAIRAIRRSECSHAEVTWQHLSEYGFEEKVTAAQPLVVSGTCTKCGAEVQRTYTTSGVIEVARDEEEAEVEVG